MARDGLLALAKAGSRLSTVVGHYLTRLELVLSGEAGETGLIGLAQEIDQTNQGMVIGYANVTSYTETRLALLRSLDEAEWAYVIGTALAAQRPELATKLQWHSPLDRGELVYVHYLCGEGQMDPTVSTHPDSIDQRRMATDLIGPRYRLWEGDHYLVSLGGAPRILWLHCGLCGVTGPRPPQVPSPQEAA